MIPYIINVSLILGGCLAFYKIFLQKETFYRINRYVLIACLAIAFSLPLLRVPQQWSWRKADEVVTVQKPVPPVMLVQQTTSEQKNQVEKQKENAAAATVSTSKASTPIPVIKWLTYLYWFGVIAFAINFLIQLIALLYNSYGRPYIQDGRFRIIEVMGDKAPCSFGNYIFINPEKYEWETYNEILMHEKEHIRQRHTLDIVFAEIVLIFQWFNPFAWLYRREIESNLEYLTDAHLVENKKVEKENYQMSLLKVAAPHFPLSITTNYNQSLLKKRIAMMNSKKSNVHTAWKYFFLLPLLVLFACLLNEPIARSQSVDPKEKSKEAREKRGIETEGSWFATIKENNIQIQFKNDEDENGSFNSTSFKLSDFTELPREKSGSFKLTREAGTMDFTGKFEGNQGMGRYKFTPNKDYVSQMSNEVDEKLTDRDAMVFFFIDIKRSYVQMLKSEGYSKIEKDELIPLAALQIEKDYIHSLKESGLKELTLEKLIPLKSLGITSEYIREIKNAGFPNISSDQLITFKAQNIDGDYISKMKQKEMKNKEGKGMDANDIVTFKTLDIDDNFANSFKSVGLTNLSREDLIPMKSLGITPEFIKSFQSIGYKDLSASDIIPLKAQDITPDFIKGFEKVGFKDIEIHEIVAVKSLGITPEYIQKMKDKGFNYTSLNKYITLKSLEEERQQ